MKTFPSTSSQIPLRLRKKRRLKQLPSEVHQIVHNLVNQLCVVNLCSFRLRGSLRDAVTPAITENIEILERAVQDATMMGEQLSQSLAEPAGLGEGRTNSRAKLKHQTNHVLAPFSVEANKMIKGQRRFLARL